jgi:hypothetical protein
MDRFKSMISPFNVSVIWLGEAAAQKDHLYDELPWPLTMRPPTPNVKKILQISMSLCN